MGGLAIDDTALEGLRTETRMDIFNLFRNGAFATSKNKLWYSECHDNYASLDVIIKIIKKKNYFIFY